MIRDFYIFSCVTGYKIPQESLPQPSIPSSAKFEELGIAIYLC